MSNPIFDFIQKESQTIRPDNQGGLFALINQVRNSPNPDALMQSLASTNPQIQSVVEYINQNGGDAKTAFYNLAAQKGVDPNTILNQLK